MSLLTWARRLLVASAMLLLTAIAVSVMTQDAWLLAAHAVSAFSAVGAAIGVLLLLAAGLRKAARQGGGRGGGVDILPHEMGLTGLVEADSPSGRSGNLPSGRP